MAAKNGGTKNDKKVRVFTLSTCIWCRKAKDLLDELGVEYECCEVDLLSGNERDKAREELKKLNPRASYPTVVIGEDVVVGFDDIKIRKALGI
ncbi:MAG: glutaredoxin family protein [Deltaproteobacteria bacterium]|nr:glutaredoxin family protein [Deltaproteobacteria bacterium]